MVDVAIHHKFYVYNIALVDLISLEELYNNSFYKYTNEMLLYNGNIDQM
jgi:hypothetical protein